MKISVVSIMKDNFNSQPLSLTAWNFSRPLSKDAVVEDALKFDVPVNEFPSMVIEVESTIIEREIISSMRNHVMWARSSRVDDIENWRVPDEIYEGREANYEATRKTITTMKKNGIAQDEYRMLLPVLSLTSYMIRIDLRSAIILYKHLLSIEGPLEKYMEGAAGEVFTKIISQLSPEPNLSVKSIKGYDLTPQVRNVGNGLTGDNLTISFEGPFTLRTHVARHRAFHMKCGFNKFINDENIFFKTLSNKIDMQLSADINFWEEILKRRSCWMVQFELWSPILRSAEIHLGLGMQGLPCSGGECPFSKDAEQRKEGKDPGAPCPIYAQLNDDNVSCKVKENMFKQADREGRGVFWYDAISILGEENE